MSLDKFSNSSLQFFSIMRYLDVMVDDVHLTRDDTPLLKLSFLCLGGGRHRDGIPLSKDDYQGIQEVWMPSKDDVQSKESTFGMTSHQMSSRCHGHDVHDLLKRKTSRERDINGTS